ncbi:NADPH:quinone reductase [Marisediminicola sp. LYQ85]|uniref:NADPH:quinone reductase n=1 Tax=Marisediminicola sp. LYQ85 TaxID=3391062 RepID=UPI0039837F24
MKTIIYSTTGDSSVLQLADRETPTPGGGEVRVRLSVSGVNPTDWKSRRGGRGELPFAEVTPNLDGAGVVDAVGPDVIDFAAGDRVWVYLAADQRPHGTAAEFTVQPVSRVVKLPDGASFDVAASLGVPAITAHRALTVSEDGPSRLSPGALADTIVLVAGGAGAVGHAAIQLARWAGATVITTVSSDEKATLARSAGAHHVVNYRDSDAVDQIRAIAPDGVDLVVEVAVVPNIGLDLAVLRTRGTLAIYANNGGSELTVDIGPLMAQNVRVQFILVYTVGQDALDAATDDITAALRDDALPVGVASGLPLTRFALADTAGAHDAVENDTVGKVLIDID